MKTLGIIGGAAIDVHGKPLLDEMLTKAQQRTAIKNYSHKKSTLYKVLFL